VWLINADGADRAATIEHRRAPKPTDSVRGTFTFAARAHREIKRDPLARTRRLARMRVPSLGSFVPAISAQ
jgi:hypothetical protein